MQHRRFPFRIPLEYICYSPSLTEPWFALGKIPEPIRNKTVRAGKARKRCVRVAIAPWFCAEESVT
jgi:hypothetical protein